MELEDLDRLARESVHSAFRLETLAQYLVPQEAEEFAAWRSGSPLPLKTPEQSPWLARIRERVDAGYRWYRVHILDPPLSEYSLFELHGYQANAAAGETIYVADRDWHPDLQRLREDFWLFDDEHVVRMIYDDEGCFVRPERTPNVDDYRRARDLAMTHAQPLALYLKRHAPQLIA